MRGRMFLSSGNVIYVKFLRILRGRMPTANLPAALLPLFIRHVFRFLVAGPGFDILGDGFQRLVEFGFGLGRGRFP